MSVMRLGYGWIPKAISPRESQWSLLHKFATWNGFSLKALHRALGIKPLCDQNLAVISFTNGRRFSQITGLPAPRFEEGLVRHYLHVDEMGLVFRTLRFCPDCLQSGYHSTLYQLTLIERCPIHQLSLQLNCVFCGSVIFMNTSGKNFKTPYGCPECKNAFIDLTKQEQIGLSEEQGRQVDALGKELRSLFNARLSQRVRWGEPVKTLVTSAEKGPLRLKMWRDVYGEGAYDNQVIHSQCTFTQEGLTRPYRWDPWAIYRAIRRYLFRHIVRPHSGCLNRIRQLGGAYEGFSCSVDIGCPLAHAFILWRLYWECGLCIADLLMGDKRVVSWERPQGLSSEESSRLFGVECLQSWSFCESLAQQMHKAGRFTLVPRCDLERREPFILNWVITDGPPKTIHWWCEPSPSPKGVRLARTHLKSVERSVRMAKRELKQVRREQVS